VTTISTICRPIRRNRRSQVERLRSMSRSMGSSVAGRESAAEAPISTAVDRKESCDPIRNSSGGCHRSTRIAASANELVASDRLPIAMPRHASQMSSVARTTGVSARTSVM